MNSNYLRSHWLLQKQNSQLRRSLIQRIPYTKLCQELQAEKLGIWQDYEILRINAKIDEEPIAMLKGFESRLTQTVLLLETSYFQYKLKL